MACPQGFLEACDFPQFFVDQTPYFDVAIMEDMRPTDGWLLNVSTGTTAMGTAVEIVQDRFRAVFPNTTKTWNRVVANGPGCAGNPCDPRENKIGYGADRLTYYAEQQTWGTDLFCFDQAMHITHAEQHVDQIINDILRPATTAISSNFLRKRHLQWAKQKSMANALLAQFTYRWMDQTGAIPTGVVGHDEEWYFDCSAPPHDVFKLVPQMLQNRFNSLMLRGYAGKNPFKETAPYIEFVADMDTCWDLDKMGGQMGVGGGQGPSVSGNWRFEQWTAANEYWRYGFSGQIGNYQVRVDPMNLRFNYVTDLGAQAGVNRYRYQIVLPYKNAITTGAGGAAGIGSDANPDFDRAHFAISHIHHKRGMELLVPDARPLNPEMPFGHRDFGGRWRFAMHDLGADLNNLPIANKWENKGQFIAWFKYYIRPLYYEYMEVFFHKREQFCIPEIDTCSDWEGYPAQQYSSGLPPCPLPDAYMPVYGTGVPTGTQDGPVPTPTPIPEPIG